MIEDYYNWEDETRLTFIEMAHFMDKDSNPLDHLIECCENAVDSGYWTLTRFNILNAKDELKRLRSKQELPYNNVAWAKINDRGDVYDLSLHFNQFADPNTVLPLYSNKEEMQELLSRHRNK